MADDKAKENAQLMVRMLPRIEPYMIEHFEWVAQATGQDAVPQEYNDQISSLIANVLIVAIDEIGKDIDAAFSEEGP